jgi:NADPH:quinone reductase-like Zn-dependent oxidoreductase
MKAAVYENYGPPEIVQIKDISIPTINDNEVLIKVHASTVNRTDCGFRSAEYFIVRFFAGLFKPKFKVLGNEFAGVIEAAGSSVNNFKVGDKVFGFNDKQFGGHAEYMKMDCNAAIALIPAAYTFIEAAPLLEGSHYAMVDIIAAKIKGGEEVLVNGATGAIGSAAVQILKYLGARVTAVCPTKQVALVKSLGADVVIDYQNEDFTKLKTEFDFIFDAVGKSSFFKCKPLLKPKGIYISTELGYLSQNPFLALLTPLFGGKKLLFPIPSINQNDANYFKALAEEGKFKPLIDRTYPLDKIVEAYEYVESRQKIGNVVVKIFRGA